MNGSRGMRYGHQATTECYSPADVCPRAPALHLLRCYLLRTTSASFLSANQYCTNVGGSLVMPKSMDEQMLMERYFGRTR